MESELLLWPHCGAFTLVSGQWHEVWHGEKCTVDIEDLLCRFHLGLDRIRRRFGPFDVNRIRTTVAGWKLVQSLWESFGG